MMDDKLKTCRLCFRDLPLSRFPLQKDQRKPRPYRYYRCYDCHAKANLRYYHSTKPPLKVYDETYRAKRKVEIRRYQRLYMRKLRRKLRFLSRSYMDKLRTGASLSPSPEWIREWNEKAKENND